MNFLRLAYESPMFTHRPFLRQSSLQSRPQSRQTPNPSVSQAPAGTHLRRAFWALCATLALASCDGRIYPPAGGDIPPAAADAAAAADSAAPVDAPALTPDAAPQIDAAPALRSCNEIYDQALEYRLCQQLDFTCEFKARTDGRNCQQLCTDFGGTCMEAYHNDSGFDVECIRIPEEGDDCSTTRNTEICICNRF